MSKQYMFLCLLSFILLIGCSEQTEEEVTEEKLSIANNYHLDEEFENAEEVYLEILAEEANPNAIEGLIDIYEQTHQIAKLTVFLNKAYELTGNEVFLEQWTDHVLSLIENIDEVTRTAFGTEDDEEFYQILSEYYHDDVIESALISLEGGHDTIPLVSWIPEGYYEKQTLEQIDDNNIYLEQVATGQYDPSSFDRTKITLTIENGTWMVTDVIHELYLSEEEI